MRLVSVCGLPTVALVSPHGQRSLPRSSLRSCSPSPRPFSRRERSSSGLPPTACGRSLALLRSYWWLFGSIALLVGYAVQAVALDHGRLAIIQPLLVTTVVFALPLGYWFTQQDVGRREILGAAIVVAGLALFAIFGDPSSGNDDAPNDEWAIALTVIVVVCAGLLVLARRAEGSREAAFYGVVSESSSAPPRAS